MTVRSPHVKTLRLIQVTHNDVNVGAGEFLQLSRRVWVSDNGEDTVLLIAFLQTIQPISVQPMDKSARCDEHVGLEQMRGQGHGWLQ